MSTSVDKLPTTSGSLGVRCFFAVMTSPRFGSCGTLQRRAAPASPQAHLHQCRLAHRMPPVDSPLAVAILGHPPDDTHWANRLLSEGLRPKHVDMRRPQRLSLIHISEPTRRT